MVEFPLKARTNLCRWPVLPETVTVSGAPLDSSITTARLDDGSVNTSTTNPELNNVLGSSKWNSEEQRQSDDDPGDSSTKSSDPQLIPTGSRQSSADPVDLQLIPARSPGSWTDPGVIPADPDLIPARSQQSSWIFS